MTVVPPDGPLGARFAVVGEAPGPQEEREGRPFVPGAPSGKVLADGMLAANLGREQARILNVCPWRPPEDETGAQRLGGRWAENVAGLQEELGKLREARSLLLIGAEAAEAVLGICGPQKDPADPHRKRRLTPAISEYHGSTFTRSEAMALQGWARGERVLTVADLPPSVHSVTVTLHPAFAVRGKPRFKRWIQTVIGRAARRSGASVGPPRLPESAFALMPSPEMVEGLVAFAGAHGLPLEMDVETPEKEPKRILLCGVGVEGSARMVFPWGAEYAAIVKRWLEGPGVTLGHNFLYDLRAFAAYGIRPGPRHVIADTMVACARLHPVDDEVRDFRWMSLGACMARHLDGRAYHKQPGRSCQAALYRAHYPALVEAGLLDRLYCGRDCEGTGALWGAAREELKREGIL